MVDEGWDFMYYESENGLSTICDIQNAVRRGARSLNAS